MPAERREERTEGRKEGVSVRERDGCERKPADAGKIMESFIRHLRATKNDSFPPRNQIMKDIEAVFEQASEEDSSQKTLYGKCFLVNNLHILEFGFALCRLTQK